MFAFLILFNSVGYYFLFFCLHYTHKKEMVKKLDADSFNPMESVIIKIPLTIPYASGTEDFERVDGEFEHQGEYYRLVKQRLSQDTLFIVCIKDTHQQKLNQAEASFIKNQLSETSDDHPSPPPPLIKDYVMHSFSISELSTGWQRTVEEVEFCTAFIPSFYPSIFLPPDLRG